MAASIIGRIAVKLKLPQWGLLVPACQPLINMEQVRHRRAKHWHPKWKRNRKEKVMKVDLPDYSEESFDEMSPEKVRSKLKQQGLLPPRAWIERSFFLSCTGGVFEPYVPPEGDGKMSVISSGGAKQKFEFLEKKSKSMMAVRKVKSFDEDFNTNEFCEQAQDLYIKSHTLLAEKDKKNIRNVITERCYPEMMYNVLDKTIRWKFLNSLEKPRVVHARCTNVISKDNIYGQITVRFHTQQLLAIYDRFGRLIHGSEILSKDVLEYVVFEKHLSNVYGSWRIHAKIIPDWMPPKLPSSRTYVKTNEPIDMGLSKSAREKELAAAKELEEKAAELTETKPALATA